MRIYQIFISAFFVGMNLFAQSELKEKIDVFKLNNPVSAGTAFSILSDLTEYNINSTPEAAVFAIECNFRNTQAIGIIKTICRANGLAYKYDPDANSLIIMTVAEYRSQLPVNVKQLVETFQVDPENLESIPQMISDLFPGQVSVNYGAEIITYSREIQNQGQGSGGSQNSGRNRSGSQGGNNINIKLEERPWLKNVDLTVDKIINIEDKKLFPVKGEKQPDVYDLIESLRIDLAPVYLTLNNEHNQIIVRTFGKKSMELITGIINKHNKKVPQVLLEMKILELTLGDGFTSSFDYQISDTPHTGDSLNLGDVTKTLASSLTYNTLHNNLQAKIQLLKKNNQLEVLATPILMAANNRVARFEVVDEDLLLTGFTTGTRNVALSDNVTGTEVFSIPQYTTENIGLTLSILPKIIDGENVTLTIEQESSDKKEAASTVQFLVGDMLEERSVDIKSERSITQTVKAMDGKTIAVGGLVNTRNVTNEEKTPILGDIPLLGYFFREEVTTNEKTELVLLITPHIIVSEEDLKKSEALLKKVSNHKFHEGGQKAVDDRVKEIEKYKNPRKDTIRDFVKDPVETLKGNKRDND